MTAPKQIISICKKCRFFNHKESDCLLPVEHEEWEFEYNDVPTKCPYILEQVMKNEELDELMEEVYGH